MLRTAISITKHTVRSGKGQKDRVTLLPDLVKEDLELQIVKARELHEFDLQSGCGAVFLPFALAKKYPYQRAYLPVNRLEDGTMFNW